MFSRMAKRIANANEQSSKKFKLDSDLNDFWGDDLNSTEVEDCLMLASQAVDENFKCTQRNNVSIIGPSKASREESFISTQADNVSILPSYGAFTKEQKVSFTSTQSNSSASFPSTSKFKMPSTNDVKELSHVDTKLLSYALQNKVTQLQGEASILRSQLKQIRTNMETEHTRKEQVWTESLKITQKEMNSIKSELEFKNLDIANLRNKIIEITKHVGVTKQINSNKIDENESLVNNHESDVSTHRYKIESVVEFGSPLSVCASIFNVSKPESYHSNLKCWDRYKGNRYLQKEDDVVVSQLKQINECRNVNFDCIYSDISILMKCNVVELDSEKFCPNINRIICISRYVLMKFHEYLCILENNMKNKDIELLDDLYMKRKNERHDTNLSLFDSKEWCDREIGIKARQMVSVLAEIVPYSRYLRGHLLENKRLNRTNENLNDDFSKYCSNRQPNFLHFILSVINVIGKIRKSETCVGFLCAVSLLLTNICVTVDINNCSVVVLNIAKEIVFTRPSTAVVGYLSNLFRVASLNKCFAYNLCSIPVQRSLAVTSDKALTFNKESCVLQVFTALYEDSFTNGNNAVDLDVNLNMLQFVTNLFSSDCSWLHYQETKFCECLLKINNLSVKIIYETLKEYKKKWQKSDRSKCREMLHCSIKLLYILTFKSADLISKYDTIESQYKLVMKSLLDFKDEFKLAESDLECLEVLNIQDTVPTINAGEFVIPLWT